jgi:NAD+ kinase
MTPPAAVTVFTHQRPEQTGPMLEVLCREARRRDVLLRFDPEETRKHGLAAAEGIEVDADPAQDVDLCVVLGGDGTILRGLRHYAGTGVPVFAVNFGEVGFLATVEPDELAAGFAAALAADFEVLTLPALALDLPGGRRSAVNDVSLHRKVGERVASLSYGVGGEEVGFVRCDGLVVATPAGSTGYNLANGGPVLAWGVEGYVVSFIAPHSLTARALVVAPSDVMTVTNRSADALDVTIDGRPLLEIGPGEVLTSRFRHEASCLAQVPGSSFYRRLREKFGRLSF